MFSLKQITWLNNKLKASPSKHLEDGVNSGCTLKGKSQFRKSAKVCLR